MRGLSATAALVLLTLASTSAAEAAGPPIITSTSASGVGETTATLQGALDPNGTRARAHFEYLTEAEYIAAGGTFSAAKSAPAKDITVEDQVKGKGTSEAGSAILTDVSAENGSLVPGQTIKAPGVLPADTTITSVQADPAAPGKQRLVLSKSALETKAEATFTASGAPQPISTSVEGLAPQTKYILRLVAERTNGSEQVVGPVTAFYTLSSTPTFPDCPANEPFRSGAFAPFGHPSDALPDCRAYEQASPLNKNGGDVLGETQFSKAADDGSSVTFGSSFGVPGAEGAQERPFYLASRGKDGWSTTGLMPPPSAGDKAQPLAGWSPDFENAYAVAIRPKEEFKQALFELHRDGSPPTQITPFALRDVNGFGPSYFVGTSADNSTVVTESFGKFSPNPGEPPIALAKENAYNVYAWERATQALHLASVMNTPEETEELLPKGAFAGPYDWMNRATRFGGALRSYYLRDERAVSSDGSVFFTAAGSGQLYQRLNPTAPQSNPGPNGYVEDGHCFEPAKACTIHISASEKTNGGPAHNGPDPAGPQPAAFQAASADGSVSYFTSSEKLTNDANTGPEQPPAQIGVAELSDPDPNATKNESFLPTHAKGIATSPDGEYLYWVDPSRNSIGRAKLNPDGTPGTVEDDFIIPGPTTYEPDPEGHPGLTEDTPSVPQYVAVGPCAGGGECVYWTNRGPLNREEKSIDGAGGIGRMRLGDLGALPEVEFITGLSNPQGIASDNEHLYWADNGRLAQNRSIGRADLDAGGAELHFFEVTGLHVYGLALTDSHLYFAINNENDDYGEVSRIPLDGGKEEYVLIGGAGVRGIAVDGAGLYWSDQSENHLGRIAIASFPPFGSCSALPGCEKDFLTLSGPPAGTAVGSGHLYFSVNGEAPVNPGVDLYRRTQQSHGCLKPAGCLEDLTPDATDPNGAEVQGVLGSSTDGSYVFFAANGDLDGSGAAQPGNCRGPGADPGGSCSLYLWHEGGIEFISRLSLGGGLDRSDSIDWSGSPVGDVGGGSSSYVQRTSFLAPDGKTLVFRSGASYYRYRVGQGVSCLTCAPSGDGVGNANLQSAIVNNGQQASRSFSVQSHHLSADGERFFFESTSALVVGDINGANGCPNVGNDPQLFFGCQDVYEWEAPGSGTCKESGPAYSPANQGCLYLISTGTSKYPSFFIDASDSGDDVFFLTRERLVGQDTDQLQDVYDARVDGGLTLQNQPPAIPCENEGCKNEAGSPPQFSAPPQISGPGNPPIKRKPCKPKKGKKGKKKGCGSHGGRRGSKSKHLDHGGRRPDAGR